VVVFETPLPLRLPKEDAPAYEARRQITVFDVGNGNRHLTSLPNPFCSHSSETG